MEDPLYRMFRSLMSSTVVLSFDAEIMNLALEHGSSVDGALAAVGAATLIGIEVVRRMFGSGDGDDNGPGTFLPEHPKPLAG